MDWFLEPVKKIRGHVISTGATWLYRVAEWRDPCISSLFLSLPVLQSNASQVFLADSLESPEHRYARQTCCANAGTSVAGLVSLIVRREPFRYRETRLSSLSFRNTSTSRPSLSTTGPLTRLISLNPGKAVEARPFQAGLPHLTPYRGPDLKSYIRRLWVLKIGGGVPRCRSQHTTESPAPRCAPGISLPLSH